MANEYAEKYIDDEIYDKYQYVKVQMGFKKDTVLIKDFNRIMETMYSELCKTE